MAAVPPNPWSAGSPSVGGSAALPVGATTALPVGALAGAASDSPLRRRRDELAEQVAEQQWDLGGLAYEMAIRDHFRLDVLVRRAAQLQACDAELAEVERLLRLEDSASVGSCPSCAAPHSRGALFCWQCGATLMERAPSAAVPAAAPSAAQDTLVRDTRAQESHRARISKRGDAGSNGDAGSTEDSGLQQRDAHHERDTLIVNPFATGE